MLLAVAKLNKLERQELHNQEKPIAYLAFQKAEMNRDKKKRNKPFQPSDFYHYNDQELLNLPEPKYGAAALALIERQLFPHWALFAYKDLKRRAENAIAPEILCFQCSDAIFLAPSIDDGTLYGMMIAANTASGQFREMQSPCGRTIAVRMPIIDDKFVAEEEAEARIIG